MKKYVFLFVLSWLALSLPAQDMPMGNALFSIHAGPSRYVGDLIGITSPSDAYRDGLRDGAAWGAGYYFLGIRNFAGSFKFAPGVIYEGGRYKNRHDSGSDKLLMHYVAPQVAIFFIRPKFNLSVSTGLGYQFYKDKSFVYGRPRNVSMDKLAYNLSAGGEYRFLPYMGLSAKLSWVASSSESYSVRYHGERWQVDSPSLNDGGRSFSRLSLLFGMNFHF